MKVAPGRRRNRLVPADDRANLFARFAKRAQSRRLDPEFELELFEEQGASRGQVGDETRGAGTRSTLVDVGESGPSERINRTRDIGAKEEPLTAMELRPEHARTLGERPAPPPGR